MNLELLVKDPAVINSISYPANTILPLIQGGQAIEVEFYSIEWSYYIIASGTVAVPEENFPCWFEDFHQTGFCEDSVNFQWGESLAPCYVGPAVGVNEFNESYLSIQLTGQVLSVSSDQRGTVSIFNLEGKKLTSNSIGLGKTEINLSQIAKGTYIVRFDNSKRTYSRKIALQ